MPRWEVVYSTGHFPSHILINSREGSMQSIHLLDTHKIGSLAKSSPSVVVDKKVADKTYLHRYFVLSIKS